MAAWYFGQWGVELLEVRLKKIISRLQGSLNRDKPPLLIIAIDEEKILGAAELKIREMDIYPEFEYWLEGEAT